MTVSGDDEDMMGCGSMSTELRSKAQHIKC